MKKYLKFVSVVVCIVLAASLLAACSCGTNGLTYSGATLESGKVNAQYSQSVADAKGADSISYALKAGSSLPEGLVLSEVGKVSGIPEKKTAGEVKFTVVASAEGYDSAEAEFKLTIGEGTMVYEGGTITATVGVQFSQSAKKVTGIDSVTYSHKSGTLPAGIEFNDGVISGTPTAVTSTAAAITVTASADEYASADAVFNITVAAGGLLYTGKALNTAYLGEEYIGDTTATATSATNETIAYALAAGSTMPLGLHFDNGVISGTPEEAGYKTFNVKASAANYNEKTVEFSISIVGDSVVYNGSVLSDGEVGSDYSEWINTAKGRGNTITYELKSGSILPDGLFLSEDGEIWGTPTATASDHKFTVVATDATVGIDPGEAEFSITVNISAENIIAGLSVGQDLFKLLPDVKGMEGAESVTYALKDGSSLPEGILLSKKGIVYGMALNTTDMTEFTVVASANGYTSAEALFGIIITEGNYKFSTGSGTVALAQSRINDNYNDVVKVAAPTAIKYKYSLKDGSVLPAGLNLRDDGLIHGTTTAAGTYSFTVTADAQGCITAEQVFSIRVVNENAITGDSLSITNFNAKILPDAYADECYYSSSDIKGAATSKASTTLTFTLKDEIGNTLPDGFVLLPNGDLRCQNLIPAAATGEYTFTVVASSMGCKSVEAVMTLRIKDPRIITRDIDIDTAIVGDAYSRSVDIAIAHDETVKYTLLYSDDMPEGLHLSSDGILYGTAVASVKGFSVQIKVSAPNHSDVNMTVSSKIRDAITVVENGVFAAAYINLIGKTGKGISDSPSDEFLIQRFSDLDSLAPGLESDDDGNPVERYFVGFTQKPIFFTFEFFCSKAVSGAKLEFSLGSEQEIVTLNSLNTVLRVNGEPITFNTVKVDGADGKFTTFELYEFTSNLSLVSGANSIEIEYLGGDANPGIEYMKISNYDGEGAVLSWSPHTYNLSGRGFELL